MKPASRPRRRPATLTVEQTVSMAETHLNDLQAEVELGRRTLEHLRETLLSTQIRQADIAGRLARYVSELRESVAEQRERLRDLRWEIRLMRDLIRNGRSRQ